MPIYEFECKECGEEFETLVLGSRDQVTCPRCGSSKAQKKMSTCAFKAGHKFVGTGKKAGAACTGCTSSTCGSCGA